MRLLQPPEHPSAAVAHYRGRSHHSLPQQLTDQKKAAKYRGKKEGSRNWKKRQQKFSTRPNFRMFCINHHVGGTEGWKLSPGGAHGEHLEASLPAPGQSAACTRGVSHGKGFKPLQYSELETFSFSARIQNEVQQFVSLKGVRGT